MKKLILNLLRYVAPIAVLALGALAAWRLIESKPPVEVREALPMTPLVRTLTAVPKDVRFEVKSQGTVSPRTETRLIPEVSGRIIEISPSLAVGAFFAQGDILLQIDPRDFELAVIRAQAEVARARQRLEIERAEAQVALREWESLGGGEEPTDLVLRKPHLEEARASLASAEAALLQSQRDLERTSIPAPFDGRVWEESVDIGQFVARGAPLARLYAVDYAEIRLPIPDPDLAFLRLPLTYRGGGDGAGPRVRLTADFAGSTHEWSGRIVRTEGEIDPRTRMVHAIAQVEDPYGRTVPGRPPLAVGLFVQAVILGNLAQQVFEIPRTALHSPLQVMIIDDQDRLRFRTVKVLRNQEDSVIIGDGLRKGDRVCVSSLETPVAGMRVRTSPEGSSTAAPGVEPSLEGIPLPEAPPRP